MAIVGDFNITGLSPTSGFIAGGTKSITISFNDQPPVLYASSGIDNYLYSQKLALYDAAIGGNNLGTIGTISYTFYNPLPGPNGSDPFSLSHFALNVTIPSNISSGTYYIGSNSQSGTRKSILVGGGSTILVSFNANGGSGTTPSPISGFSGGSFKMPGQAGLYKNGYRLLGWARSSSATSKQYSLNVTYTFTDTSNFTLYAVWSKIDYSISIDSNGGGSVSGKNYRIQSFTQNFTLTIPTAPTGRRFFLWVTTSQPSPSIDSAFAGEILTIPANTYGNVTLQAHWIYIDYSITYNLQSGSGSHGNPTSYTYGTATFNLVQRDMTRTGYMFKGWYDASSGGNKITSIPEGSIGNKTLYAQWEIIRTTVTFKNVYTKGDGTEINETLQSDTDDYGTQITFDGSTPVKEVDSTHRYNFLGWHVDNGSEVVYSNLGTYGVSNVTFYAIYVEKLDGFKVGSKRSNLKIGENQVQKVYKGTSIIWEKNDDV